jgi:hypothetical protein
MFLLMACPVAPPTDGGTDTPQDTVITNPPTDTIPGGEKTVSKFDFHEGYEVVFIQTLGTDPRFPFLYNVTTYLNGEKVRFRKSSYNKALTTEVQDGAAVWEIEEHRLSTTGTVIRYDNYYVVIAHLVDSVYFYDIFKGGGSGSSRIRAHDRITKKDEETLQDLADIVTASLRRVDMTKVTYAPEDYPCCYVEYYDHDGTDHKYTFILYQQGKVAGSTQKFKNDIEEAGETFKEGAEAIALQYIIDNLTNVNGVETEAIEFKIE